MQAPKICLFAVLNWGLGHATRSIPIIKSLLTHHVRVHLASDGQALTLLKKEFPQLSAYKLPAYNIRYNDNHLLGTMMIQTPKIIKTITNEYLETQKIIKQISPNLIISDNRYGVRSNQVLSILMCHQWKIPLSNPILSYFLNKAHRFFIKKFDKLWIPDAPPPHNLTGQMTAGTIHMPHTFIGTLSRLKIQPKTTTVQQILAILSGPEPQRTTLETKLTRILSDLEMPSILIRGVIQDKEATVLKTLNRLQIINFLTSEKLNTAIAQSEIIICRSGYSSILDLVHLQKKAILIPTPNQPEQEYLARFLGQKDGFVIARQDNLNITAAIKLLLSTRHPTCLSSAIQLDEVIRQTLTQC